MKVTRSKPIVLTALTWLLRSDLLNLTLKPVTPISVPSDEKEGWGLLLVKLVLDPLFMFSEQRLRETVGKCCGRGGTAEMTRRVIRTLECTSRKYKPWVSTIGMMSQRL